MKESPIQETHLSISRALVGQVVRSETDRFAEVTLTATREMTADEKGLIHGGFTFGLADYAAMAAVNHPFVVLLSSEVKFLKPVVIGDRLTAQARVTEAEGRKRKVSCEVFNQDREKVLAGEFLCLILGKHVLEK